MAKNAWKVVVEARLAEVTQRIESDVPAPDRPYPSGRVATATSAVNSTPTPIGAWTGSDVETAWINLHAAEVACAQHPAATAAEAVALAALARAKRSLPQDDPRVTALTEAVKVPSTPATVALAAGTLEAAFAASDEDHRQLRSFRNILFCVAVGALMIALLVGLIASWSPKSVNLCWSTDSAMYCPTERSGATGGDVFAVELLGMLGAALVGAVAVRRLRGTSTPYSVGIASLALKVPLGALTAVAGLLLTHLITGFAISSALQLKAYALVFGGAQQAVTTMLDRQAKNVLDSVTTSSSSKTEGG